MQKSTFKDYNLYVVDNASSDDSVAQVKKNFKQEELILIQNEENLGGSGGFNTGIREALKGSYKYIMLLDNDAMVEEKSIEKAIEYLEENNDVGMLGFKLYSMDNPNQIQEFGADIDFENYTIKPYYKGYTDDGSIPQIKECDYVPACSVIVRKDAVLKVGLMPEENFIYWDDIEWGYLFNKNGYKVIAYADSKAWHKMGVKQKVNTFGTYYFWRNRIRFFMKYCNKESRKILADKIYEEITQSICTCNYNGKYNSAATIMQAALDAAYGVSGKADDNKILICERIEDRFQQVISKYEKIIIISNNHVEFAKSVVNRINNLHKRIDILSKNDLLITQINYNNVKFIENINNFDKDKELILELCDHILNLDYNLNNIEHAYIDIYYNLISNNEEFENMKNIVKSKSVLNNIFEKVIKNLIIAN